jgi:hypothetical protein
MDKLDFSEAERIISLKFLIQNHGFGDNLDKHLSRDHASGLLTASIKACEFPWRLVIAVFDHCIYVPSVVVLDFNLDI